MGRERCFVVKRSREFKEEGETEIASAMTEGLED
jgi:hypothetical protein